jgi:two-component system, LytTR family, response regulator
MKYMTNSPLGILENDSKIALISSKVIRFVDQHEIIYLQSDNCYTKIYLYDNSKFTMCKTLKIYESLLNKELFFRCHRSFLVNIVYVKEISRYKLEHLILSNGGKIPISRRRVMGLKRRMLSTTNTFSTSLG